MESINITNCRAGFSLIDIKTTSFEFRKIKFDGNLNNAFYSDNSTLNLKNITILNHNCFEKLHGCTANIYDSLIEIQFFEINALKSHIEEGTFYFWKAEGEISNMNFNNIQNFKQIGSCISGYESKLNIKNSSFSKYDSNCIYAYDSIFSIDKCQFDTNTNTINGFIGDYGAIFSVNTYMCILDSKFIGNFFSLNGAGIYLSDSFSFLSPLKTISNTTFIRNSVRNQGGGLFLKNQNIEIDNCTFLENVAENGGAIYLYNEGKNKIVKIYGFLEIYQFYSVIKNCNFIRNKAKLDGGAFNWYGKIPNFTGLNNLFEENDALYGLNNASFPAKLSMEIYNKMNKSDLKLIYSSFSSEKIGTVPEVSVGNQIVYDLIVSILDIDDNVVSSADG